MPSPRHLEVHHPPRDLLLPPLHRKLGRVRRFRLLDLYLLRELPKRRLTLRLALLQERLEARILRFGRAQRVLYLLQVRAPPLLCGGNRHKPPIAHRVRQRQVAHTGRRVAQPPALLPQVDPRVPAAIQARVL